MSDPYIKTLKNSGISGFRIGQVIRSWLYLVEGHDAFNCRGSLDC